MLWAVICPKSKPRTIRFFEVDASVNAEIASSVTDLVSNEYLDPFTHKYVKHVKRATQSVLTVLNVRHVCLLDLIKFCWPESFSVTNYLFFGFFRHTSIKTCVYFLHFFVIYSLSLMHESVATILRVLHMWTILILWLIL